MSTEPIAFYVKWAGAVHIARSMRRAIHDYPMIPEEHWRPLIDGGSQAPAPQTPSSTQVEWKSWRISLDGDHVTFSNGVTGFEARVYIPVLLRAIEAAAPASDPRCADCDLPNGCPEYCRCKPEAGLTDPSLCSKWPKCGCPSTFECIDEELVRKSGRRS